jgi:kynurenine 3-monooxygenase
MFEAIDTNEKLMEFFATYFKDIIPLIGEETLKKDYFQNPRGSLISIKASPHHVLAKGILLGDAAHAMVPFYGQGLNCGLQDVQVLFKVLDEHLICSATVPFGLQQALEAYSAERVEDCHAMCDLAMYNHKELRSGVTSLSYLVRRRLERWIHRRAPQVLVPLYCMVSFSTIPYSEAIRRWRRQSIGILVVLSVLALISMTSLFWLIAQGVTTVYS